MTTIPSRSEALRAAIKRWWAQPPRRHGEIIEGRTVGFVELFFDLVFVVLVGRAAHALAHDLTWVSAAQFVVMFSLLFIAWQNGTLFQDLHGREDGRSRNLIFTQMMLLVILSVFVPTAFAGDGRWFALTFAAILTFDVRQWWIVRQLDDERWRQGTFRYTASSVVMIVVLVASAFVGEQARWWLWVAVALGATVGTLIMLGSRPTLDAAAFFVTESLVERFGLFVIIVLGETVVGVANGLLAAHERNLATFGTGLLALQLTFGFWWSYFDTTRGQQPRPKALPTANWLFWHLPLAGSIAAAGAGMVGLVEAPTAPSGPSGALVGCATGLTLISTIAIGMTQKQQPYWRKLAALAFVVALAATGVGVANWPGWLTALLLAAAPLITWGYAFVLQAELNARTFSSDQPNPHR